MPNIPEWMLNNSLRESLIDIDNNIKVLRKWHKKLIAERKKRKLTAKEQALLITVINKHNKLEKIFKKLCPTLSNLLTNIYK